MKEFNAIKELYEELVVKYRNLKIEDRYFEMNYLVEYCFLRRVIKNKEEENSVSSINHDLFSTAVNRCLEVLVKMEKSFNELRDSNSQN